MNIPLNGIKASINKAGARIGVIGLHADPGTDNEPILVGLGTSLGSQL